MRTLVVIAHNIRSTHNVGSLLRTAEGLGVQKVYLTGYTPYPSHVNDTRLPHLSRKITAAIQKTALNAQDTVDWEYQEDIHEVLNGLRRQNYVLCALEQTTDAINLHEFKAPQHCALLLGSEVTGISDDLIALTDVRLVIPMFGKKESFNVVQAAAMALYQIRFN